MKPKRKVIIIIVLLLLFPLSIYLYNNYFPVRTKSKKISDSIDGYGYTLNDRQSEVYKKYFVKLKNVLKNDPVDEEAYLKLISKMFIIDTYSLDDKIDNNDIGGVEFVLSDVVDNYKAKMMDTLYLYVQSDLYGKRKQVLPVVKDVYIDDIKVVSYSYLNGITDPKAYQVKVNWQYEKDLGYAKEAVLYFVHDDSKLSLVEFK